ncbi:1332_t:CDS:2, partial [Funneliformis caledonium]
MPVGVASHGKSSDNTEHTQEAIDYLEWTTTGTKKSTNRIDDILVLTTKGEDLVSQINLGIEKDQQCWYWVIYCSDDGDICQHLCSGIGKCLETCDHYLLHNNLKNANDMHLCSVRVISECQLLDSIALSRRADHRTAKGIKAKLLTSFNVLASQHEIYDNDKLRRLIIRDDRKFKDNTGSWTQLNNLVNELLKSQGNILYYQTPDLDQPIESSDRYYQLTFSDEFWLKNRHDHGNICIGIDGKYDLN